MVAVSRGQHTHTDPQLESCAQPWSGVGCHPGIRFQAPGSAAHTHVGCRVSSMALAMAKGPGSRVQGPVQGPGSRVQGPGPRVQGPGSRVQGQGSRVRSRVQGVTIQGGSSQAPPGHGHAPSHPRTPECGGPLLSSRGGGPPSSPGRGRRSQHPAPPARVVRQ